MPASRLHPFLRLLLCAIVVGAVTLGISIVAGGILFALGSRLGLANLPPDKMAQKLTHDYGLILTVCAYPPALFVVWLFRTQVDQRSWRSLGFHRVGSFSNFSLGALTGILTLSVLFSLMWLSGAIQFNGLSQDVLTHGWVYSVVALLFYAVAFLLVGFMEETAFRGYGLHNAKDWLGWTGGVWLQAIVFALIHLTNVLGNSDPNALKAAIGALPSLALIAVFFALAYRKTGSLWFPIGFHFAWNFSLGCIFSQPVSAIGTFRLFDVQETGKNFLSGGDFGAEGSFFLIPLVVALIFLLWRSPDHPQAIADFDEPEQTIAPSQAPYSTYAMALGTPLSATNEATVVSNISSPPTTPETDQDTPLRKNRYGARFGSAEGFDEGMLRDLKQMQESREEAERQRLEAERAMRQAESEREETLRRAQIAAQNSSLQKEAESTSSTTNALPDNTPSQAPVTSAPVVTTPAATPPVETSPSLPEPQPRVEAPKSTLPSPTAPAIPPTPIIPPAQVVPPAPVIPAAPTTPPTPVVPPTPASTSPAPLQPPAPSNPPSEAPPKKARPRW